MNYPPPGYGQHYPPQQQWPVAPPPRNGMGTAALVLGIAGLVLAFIPLVGVVAWPLVIVGLILGVVALVRAGRGEATNRGVAIAGVACSSVGLLVCTLWVVGLAASAPAPPTAASAPAVGGAQPVAGEAKTEFVAGETADLDGLQVTAGPLVKQRSAGQSLLCSMVNYNNGSDDTRFFNGGFDWKLQTPAGVIKTTSLFGEDNLSAGQLAPGGTVAGNVCFEDPKQKGDYWVITDVAFWSNQQVKWKASI